MTDLLMTVGDLTITDRFVATRSLTESLASPLSAEDQTVQSMPDVSPTKWHRAHTTWFFETFLLIPSMKGYRPFHPDFGYLFNSYYEGVGARYPRNDRGLLSRPGVEEIGEYRAHVDRAMTAFLEGPSSEASAALVELGIQHEQQHQELLLMDIKHVLSRNPLLPAYDAVRMPAPTAPTPPTWTEHPAGTYEIGHSGRGFCFDNELPRHRTYVGAFALADQVTTCGEWLAFIDDGGYHRPELWLSDGWAAVQSEGWECPLYWTGPERDGQEFTLGGPTPVNPAQPVCHLSYYEADAFARWAGMRLPTEAEWELAAAGQGMQGHFLDQTKLHPTPDPGSSTDSTPFGNVWQWTSSAYSPYPGFEPAPGAVGEYNGKFMVNQYVLRGGSCVTPPDHVRASYRNFFPPSARWAFTGLRLARNC
ncbi:MAG: ergothioneine biosynthesis protein EgtB [Acidimicrobiales bacterium]|jgi:ergothioneine biosynthesis protein EgtB